MRWHAPSQRPGRRVRQCSSSVNRTFPTPTSSSSTRWLAPSLASPAIRVSGTFDAGRAIDLHDNHFAFDGMHLTPEGNRHMADVLAAPLLALRPGGPR